MIQKYFLVKIRQNVSHQRRGVNYTWSIHQHTVKTENGCNWCFRFGRLRVFTSFITKTRLFKYIENFTTKKNENFQIKKSDIFLISAQNIDCGYSLEPPRGGGSNEYPQSMFLSRNKKNNVYPCKPQFYYIKVGFKGVKSI